MFIQPPHPPQIDNGMFPSPPGAGQSAVDGGYNDATRSFSPNGLPVQGQFNPQHVFNPNLQRPPIIMPHNPAPQMPPNLAQMRNLMTQFHVQQMLARMQSHIMHHSGGGNMRAS